MRTILKPQSKMGRTSGVDSGNETEEGSPDLASVPTTPHNFSDRINQDKVVIRPVAFKPTGLPKGSNGPRYGSTPSLARPGSILTLYGSSSDLRQRRNYSLDRKRGCSPLTMSSLPLDSSGPRSLGYESLDSIYTPTPSVTKEHYRSGRVSEVGLPPVEPKDRGDDLESALRERDSELQYLRQTMSENEQAIIRVHQDKMLGPMDVYSKERAWGRELRRMKEAQDARVHAATSKALRLEQMLVAATQRLQAEKRRSREEADAAREAATAARREASTARARLEDADWALCQKSGEVALLKSQLKDLQTEQSTKCQELMALKMELREVKAALESRDTDISKLRIEVEKKEQKIKELEIDNLTLTIDDINKISEKEDNASVDDITKLPETLVDDGDEAVDYRAEWERAEATLRRERLAWDSERAIWAGEKEKVIAYQRQLQINYVQMYKRTQYLEDELDRLRETAATTDKLAAISSTSIQL